MKAYLVRLPAEDGEQVEEVGLVVAQSLKDLFGILDEFTSPYIYQFSVAKAGDAVLCSTQMHKCVEEGFEDDGNDGYLTVDTHRGDTQLLSEEVTYETQRKWRQFRKDKPYSYETEKAA